MSSIWRPVRADLRRIVLQTPGVVHEARFELQKPAEPVVGIAHLTDKLEKGPARPVTAGTRGQVQEDGIYHLDLHWPTTLVKAEGEDMADAIRLAYWPGRAIDLPEIWGMVETSSVRDPIPGINWLVFPVRVGFFIRRRTRFGVAA